MRKEVRCKCNKFLFTFDSKKGCPGIEIKCHKCGKLNLINIEPKEAEKAS